MGVVQTAVWIAAVALVGGVIWWMVGPMARFRSDHSTSVLHSLRIARAYDWHVLRHGRAARVERLVPDDPTTRRRAVERLRSADPDVAGFGLVTAEVPVDGGREIRVFYVLTPWEADEVEGGNGGGAETASEVVYLRSLDSVTRTHASRGSVADRIVRTIRESAGELHMAWVARGHVGLGFEADAMTNPSAWARWLAEMADDVAAGRAVLPPPARW